MDSQRSTPFSSAFRLADLTHPLDEHTPRWPDDPPFVWEALTWGRGEHGQWYACGAFRSPEHIGTHIDAPLHFGEGQPPIGAIPVERLVAPAAVIDIREACAADRNYRLSVSDLDGWERRNGVIAGGSIVVVRTGWSRYWPDREAYFGTDDEAGPMSFPGVGTETAQRLMERGVSAVGIDTASVDAGEAADFPAHKILNAAGILHIENLTNLECLPATGATIFALPLKLAHGSGAPARVVAVLP